MKLRILRKWFSDISDYDHFFMTISVKLVSENMFSHVYVSNHVNIIRSYIQVGFKLQKDVSSSIFGTIRYTDHSIVGSRCPRRSGRLGTCLKPYQSNFMIFNGYAFRSISSTISWHDHFIVGSRYPGGCGQFKFNIICWYSLDLCLIGK